MTLSVCSGTPFTVKKISPGRSTPAVGLILSKPVNQHLIPNTNKMFGEQELIKTQHEILKGKDLVKNTFVLA